MVEGKFKKIFIMVLGIIMANELMPLSHAQPRNKLASIAGIQVSPSNRYYQKNGRPFFFIGYADWAPVVKGERYKNGVSLKDLIDLAARYDLNYIRVSMGLGGDGGYSIPFKRINGKVDLDQWDPDYWNAATGLKYQAQYAQNKGVNLHIAIFDGIGFEDQERWSWPNSYWNIDNQTRDFYGDLNTDGDDGIDEMDEFYRLSDFVNNTGVGFYQKKLIDKAISELSSCNNVFFEVGNELMGSNTQWNFEVIRYIQSQTDKPVTINMNPPQHVSNNPKNDQGYSIHVVEPKGHWEGGHDSSLEVKNWAASDVGGGVPVWYASDGSSLMIGHAEENRRAAWYSLVEGAAGYGGFQMDVRNEGPDTTKLRYYHNLMSFLVVTGVPFWTMAPRHSLISNSAENSLLADAGGHYLAYVRDDDSVTIDLAAGSYKCEIYNPKTGTYSAGEAISNWGGGRKIFNRPSGEDWVIYVY